MPAAPGPDDEPVHLAAVDVADRVAVVGRPAGVAVGGVVVGPDARLVRRIGYTHRRHPALHRDAVGAGIRPEVGVERAVLLHDHDDVLDVVDAGIRACAHVGGEGGDGGGGGGGGGCEGSKN